MRKSPSMSLSHTLNKNEKVKQYIRKMILKPNKLRFWVNEKIKQYIRKNTLKPNKLRFWIKKIYFRYSQLHI